MDGGMHGRLNVDNRGFTLMEVIAVLVLMAIFAMLAVSRQPTTDMTLRAGAEVLKSHLRYAQMRAMSSDSGWGIRYQDGQYWLFPQLQGITRQVALPGEPQNSVDLLSRGISVVEGNFTLVFDPWGVPDTTASTLSFTNRQTILNLAKNGETNQPIAIRQNTGFIQ